MEATAAVHAAEEQHVRWYEVGGQIVGRMYGLAKSVGAVSRSRRVMWPAEEKGAM